MLPPETTQLQVNRQGGASSRELRLALQASETSLRGDARSPEDHAVGVLQE